MAEPSLNFIQHGLRPTSKLVIFTLAAVALLLLDNRYDAIQKAKSYTANALYPVQWLANQPVRWAQHSANYLRNQHDLLQQNAQLKTQNAQLQLQLQQKQVILQESTTLLKLQKLNQDALPQAKIAQIISTGANPLAERFTIDKGSRDQVRMGDPVTDEHGLIGQISSVQAFSAEVSLSTNSQAVIPAMVARTGVRTLVYGRSGGLDLRYFPSDASLQNQDLLITSGMDSIYPAGIPIATISAVQKGNGSPYYKTQLTPVANLLSSRFVMVIPQKAAIPTHQPAPAASAPAIQ